MQDLIKEFPEYKCILHHVDQYNNIVDHYTYIDYAELMELKVLKETKAAYIKLLENNDE